ncbi:Uncharacterised protein [Yersinia frederiksenii]|nr:Uncharacterised protein [Yersinia frederiksenii]
MRVAAAPVPVDLVERVQAAILIPLAVMGATEQQQVM